MKKEPKSLIESILFVAEKPVSVKELAAGRFNSLSVLLVEAAEVLPRRAPGLPDEAFERGDVPMTKQEVRAAVLAKLAVRCMFGGAIVSCINATVAGLLI